MKRLFSLLFILTAYLCAIELDKVEYSFSDQPIDVIIPCHSKDASVLDRCIKGIKTNGDNIRRVIVVSKEKITDEAEWFDESKYPFSFSDVERELINGEKSRKVKLKEFNRVGWYYQQLLKFYSAYVIEDISENILILDADSIFFKPVSFINKKGAAKFSFSHQYVKSYFDHAFKFVPHLKRVFDISGICHHMLFQKPVLDNLFNIVETAHGKPLWKAFCHLISTQNLYFVGASEYETYFNFAFCTSDQFSLRKLRQKDVFSIEMLESLKDRYDYLSIHAWSRKDV